MQVKYVVACIFLIHSKKYLSCPSETGFPWHISVMSLVVEEVPWFWRIKTRLHAAGINLWSVNMQGNGSRILSFVGLCIIFSISLHMRERGGGFLNEGEIPLFLGGGGGGGGMIWTTDWQTQTAEILYAYTCNADTFLGKGEVTFWHTVTRVNEVLMMSSRGL